MGNLFSQTSEGLVLLLIFLVQQQHIDHDDLQAWTYEV